MSHGSRNRHNAVKANLLWCQPDCLFDLPVIVLCSINLS
jgi:hypothetical protein